MDNQAAHKDLVARTKIALSQEWPQSIRVFDRHVGLFINARNRTPVKINKPGMADNWAILSCVATSCDTFKLPIHSEII